jgi:hypothetical protein
LKEQRRAGVMDVTWPVLVRRRSEATEIQFLEACSWKMLDVADEDDDGVGGFFSALIPPMNDP